MNVYDFSVYAERRKERQAAEAVAGIVAELNKPGAVLELKARVNSWFDLHRELQRKVG